MSAGALLGALAMAVAVGLGFGFYPAWRSAHLQPMEAATGLSAIRRHDSRGGHQKPVTVRPRPPQTDLSR